jgi:hypothetical protein
MRLVMSATFALVLLVAGVGLVTARNAQPDNFDPNREIDSRIRRGFQIAPVRLNLRGLTPAFVGLGSYIVNAQGGCNDCHTAPPYAEGGDPFRGEPEQINAARYLAGGIEFGPFTSRNLTPQPPDGLPANLTFEQFRDSLRHGTDFKHLHPDTPLLQVMPWPVYGKMSSLDLSAIYEFLRAIPSLPSQP